MKIQAWNISRNVVVMYLANGFAVVLGGAIAYGVYSVLSAHLQEFIVRSLSNFPPLR